VSLQTPKYFTRKARGKRRKQIFSLRSPREICHQAHGIQRASPSGSPIISYCRTPPSFERIQPVIERCFKSCILLAAYAMSRALDVCPLKRRFGLPELGRIFSRFSGRDAFFRDDEQRGTLNPGDDLFIRERRNANCPTVFWNLPKLLLHIQAMLDCPCGIWLYYLPAAIGLFLFGRLVFPHGFSEPLPHL